MNTQKSLEEGMNIVTSWIEEQKSYEDNRMDVWVKPEHLKSCIKALVDEKWGYLITITGLDNPAQDLDDDGEIDIAGMIEGLYHFASSDSILTIRVKVPYDKPVLDTICDLLPSSTLYEREFMELFGVDIVGTPNTDHLILPDGWPEEVYPLRKSFSGISPEDLE